MINLKLLTKKFTIMKKVKNLKLDTLSSNELANKEANQIRGGSAICPCLCTCPSTEERIFIRMDEKLAVYNDNLPEI